MWSLYRLLNGLISELDDNTEEQQANTTALGKNTVALLEANELAAETNLLLGRILDRLRFLPQPGPLSILVTSENGNMLTFTVQLPAEPAGFNDIASGELTVKIGDAEPSTITTSKGQTEVPGLSGAQDAALSLSFVYIDDAGNKSEASTFSDTLKDTIAPATPGALGITVTGETE